MHFHFYVSGPGGLLFFLVLAVLYFVPTMVALKRGKHNPGATIVVNVFLGWTFIGWVVALAMAFGETSADRFVRS
ncbi:MAG TPA: superinfection immunity protein [Chloroflexota bacterium]|jgi:hypothetical protein|nr:superinfection immunity protein [Chloroflexota bacterium]